MAPKKLFDIVGIKPPGLVHLYQVGEVKLHELSDDRLMQLYQQGHTEFIQPTEAGFAKLFPGQKTIKTVKIEGENKQKKK